MKDSIVSRPLFGFVRDLFLSCGLVQISCEYGVKQAFFIWKHVQDNIASIHGWLHP